MPPGRSHVRGARGGRAADLRCRTGTPPWACGTTFKSLAKASALIDLQIARLAAVAVEPVGPDLRAGLGRDELGVDPDRLAHAARAAFE
jgi:hypothetical protein